MAIHKTEAFIIKRRPFRSSSLIITAYSRSFGKLKGIVKGVRREGAAWPSTFEPFTLLEIVFYEKIRSEIHLVSEASILETFDELRQKLDTLAAAFHMAALVDQLTETQDPNESIFELLYFTFRLLPSFPSSLVLGFFEIRLLYEVGLLPHLASCVGCGEENPEKVYFSTRQGAIFCPRCRKRSPEAILLSRRVLEAMRQFINHKITEIAQFSLDEDVEREMQRVIERFLTEKLGRPLATRRFLNQVRSLKTQGASLRYSGSTGRRPESRFG